MKQVIAGAALATAARAALPHLLKAKFTRDVARLNAGDHGPLLEAYADDFVLHFNDGDHRWAGDWTGKDGMDRFLRLYTAAGVQGRIGSITVSGPPWALTMWVRFDDWSDDGGTRLYENRTVLVLRTKWGKVVDQEDYYFDTERIAAFERALVERGR